MPGDMNSIGDFTIGDKVYYTGAFQRALSLSPRAEGVVAHIGTPYCLRDRVLILFDNQHEWCILPRDLSHISKQKSKQENKQLELFT